MIRNYIKIAWRNIRGNRVSSILNILGLTSGLFCFLLIYLWISNEKSIDNYHANIDGLYSVYLTSTEGDVQGYETPSLLYKELKLKIPEIKNVSVMSNYSTSNTFSSGSKVIKQQGKYISEDFFKMFSFNFIKGNATTAMSAPDHIAISKKMAELFFENPDNAIGQTLTLDNTKELKVSAVFETGSPDTSEKSDFYLTFNSLFASNPWMKDWKNLSPYTFIQLSDGTEIEKIEPKLKTFLKDYNLNLEIHLQPYGRKYLYADIANASGKIEYIRIFGIISFLIILIACINFMNLASAESIKRAKEIGVRKVMGAGKKSLATQFLIEAMFLTLISLFFTIILIALILPAFNQITDKNIILANVSFVTWLMVFVISILTGLLSGSYPAFILSSYKIVDVFKKKNETNSKSKWIRNGLVVFQFTISIIFISGLIIISKQIDFVKNKDIGFDRENLIAISLNGDIQKNFDAFKSEASQIPGVHSLTKASHIPLGEFGTSPEVIWKGKTEDDATLFTGMVASPDFVSTYGVQLMSGRDFRHNNPDNIEYIINETAMKKMDMENPIGQTLSFWGNSGIIVGVVKDFHFSSLKESIFPMILRSEGYPDFNVAFVKLNPNSLKQSIASLGSIHMKLNPAFPFEYKYVNEEYDKLYKSESVFYKLSKYFSLLAILISCLGLFGLVIFTTEQRTKEIGIRKVLGASVFRINALIIKDFIKLILLGIIIGTLISWFIMDMWLANYDYRIDMPWSSFWIAGVLAIGIALFTISFQSIKAAFVNPIKSLKSE